MCEPIPVSSFYVPVEGDPCPSRGHTFQVECMDFGETVDVWHCRVRGDEWCVPMVTRLKPAPQWIGYHGGPLT